MFITLATDMALKRQETFVSRVEKIAELVQYALVMTPAVKYTERIVNKDGKVISRWNS